MADFKKNDFSVADFSLAAVFSDHMVLQRNKYVSVFGNAKDGIVIKVSLCNEDGLMLGR